MKRQEQAVSILTMVVASALWVALVAVIPHAGAGGPESDTTLMERHKIPCNSYSYTSCPRGCYAQCVPSACQEMPNGQVACTADCEGPGSCAGPTDL